tara:strand:+ start:1071 stop:2012 length:942 start_codon:yes stop_codon:yes gene_type:complete
MISFILRRLATYLSFLFINKPSDLSKNDKILNKIYKRMSKTKIKSLNLKDTHIKFNSEIYRLLKTKKIKNFLRESFIQKMFFVHNRLFILNELKYLYKDIKWNFYKKLLVEDNVGNPVRYFLYPKSSGNKINHVFHLCTLINQFNIDIKKIKNVFEFGGGYGCMARIFSKINKDIKYTCFDTFHVNLIQFYYLKYNDLNVGFSKKNNFFLTSELKEIQNYYLNNSNYIFIANWSISETPINFRKKFEVIIKNSKYILISFQENFENLNNLNYFTNLKKEISRDFKVNIIKNKFYKGNIFKRENHFYFLAKKVK